MKPMKPPDGLAVDVGLVVMEPEAPKKVFVVGPPQEKVCPLKVAVVKSPEIAVVEVGMGPLPPVVPLPLVTVAVTVAGCAARLLASF